MKNIEQVNCGCISKPGYRPHCQKGKLLCMQVKAAINMFNGNSEGLSPDDITTQYTAIQSAEQAYIKHCNHGELRPLNSPERV